MNEPLHGSDAELGEVGAEGTAEGLGTGEANAQPSPAKKPEAACEAVRGDLEAFYYGDLDEDGHRAVDAHLSACAACREALTEVRATAAALDRVPVVKPSAHQWARFQARLDSRVAAARAGRLAGLLTRTGRWERIAAAVLIGGLGTLAALLFLETRTQDTHIAELRQDIADLKWNLGDYQGARAILENLLVTGTELDPRWRRRLEAFDELAGEDPRAVGLYRAARTEWGSGVRERLREFLASFPEHILADEVFNALRQSGLPSLRPEEEVVRRPLVPFSPPLPGAQEVAHYRGEMAKLRSYAEKADPQSAAYARFRAARIAEEIMRDLDLARAEYAEALQSVPEGAMREAMRARLAELGVDSDR